MKKIQINYGKVAFLLCNFVFLLSGVCLVFLGCVLLNDSPRILLSQLFLEPGLIAKPLLYYVALALIVAGLVVSAVSVLGCWASWDLNSNWPMGFYICLLIVLLLIEISFVVVGALCPHVIGVVSDRDQMVAGLMNNYGVPGRSQYTAAVDLAQTLLECCGMQSGSDYDGSKWWKREQETKHDLRVPHSCCFLSNAEDETSFLNPKPINSSLCQAKTNSRYQHGRHVKGCIDKLNSWFEDHVTIFLFVGLGLVTVQLAVLLCALLVCLKPEKRNPPEGEEIRISDSSEKKNQTSEHSELATGKVHRAESENRNNSIKSVRNPIEKLNLDEIRGTDSLPLVLKRDGLRLIEDAKSNKNVNSVRMDSWARSKISSLQNQVPEIYFTPRYHDSTERNPIFDVDFDDRKLNEESKIYFCKSEKFGLDNRTCESCQET